MQLRPILPSACARSFFFWGGGGGVLSLIVIHKINIVFILFSNISHMNLSDVLLLYLLAVCSSICNWVMYALWVQCIKFR